MMNEQEKEIELYCVLAVPGPVTNHTIRDSDELIIEWYPPTNPNGNLSHYLVEWQHLNETRAVNVSFHDKQKATFKLPHTPGYRDSVISIQAVSEVGRGIAVKVDLANLPQAPAQETSPYNSYVGISISLFLSAVCICFCLWIIVRHRRCVKRQRQAEMNGAAAHRNLQNRASNSMSVYSSSVAVTADSCFVEVHEMQTLIAIPNGTILVGDKRDELRGKHKNGSGKVIKISDSFNENDSLPPNDAENDSFLCRKDLIASIAPSRSNRDSRKNSTRESSDSIGSDQAKSSSKAAKRRPSATSAAKKLNHSHDDAAALINTSDNGDDKLSRNTSADSNADKLFTDHDGRDKNVVFDASNDSSSSSSSSASNDTISETSSHSDLVNDQIDKMKSHNQHDVYHPIQTDNIDNNKKSTDECISDDSYFQKSLQKWDYRRPIVGPNG